jgi:calcium-dependent protein kinase
MEVDQLIIQVFEYRIKEFAYATINREKLLATERLLQAFKIIDKDKSGAITKDEIKHAFG